METMFVLGFTGVYLLICCVSLAVSIMDIIALYKLYEKAGESGWKSLIPFYNFFVLSKIVTGKYNFGAAYMILTVLYGLFIILGVLIESLPLMLFAMLLALPVIVMAVYLYYQLGKVYGKSSLWCVMMIFLYPLLIIAMAFDNDTVYEGPLGQDVSGDMYFG